MVSTLVRDEFLQTGAPTSRLPTWLVSAAHVRRVMAEGREERVPFATHHARQIGASTTACGILAVNWVNFYSSAFLPGEPGACHRCAAAIGTPRPKTS